MSDSPAPVNREAERVSVHNKSDENTGCPTGPPQAGARRLSPMGFEPVIVHDEAELLIRLEAIATWCDHAVAGHTEPERALGAVELLVQGAKRFQRRKVAA